MATVRPFRAASFDASDGDWMERLLSVTSSPRLKEDRSQYVRFARGSAAFAEMKQQGLLTASTEPEFYVRTVDGQSWLFALAEVSDVLPSQLTKPIDHQNALRLTEAINTWFAAQPVFCDQKVDISNPTASLQSARLYALGDHQLLSAAKEFGENRSGTARGQIPVAIALGENPSFPTRRRCISLDKMSVEDLRLRLSEHFELSPVHRSQPMAISSKSGLSFWIVEPDGSVVRADASSLFFLVHAPIDDRAKPPFDQVSLFEQSVVQGLLGMAGSDSTQKADDQWQGKAGVVQFVLDSMQISEIAEVVKQGRLLPHQSIDVDPVVPLGALIWSLQDFRA